MGFRCRIFERRKSAEELKGGADVGLWPGAVDVLKAYGVGMDDPEWWDRETWPVKKVKMVNDTGGVIRSVDMDAVNPVEGGSFRLIGRRGLMSELVELVGMGNMEFGREFVSFAVDGEGLTAEITGAKGTERVRGFMVLGADGIGSTVRKILRGKSERPRYAGEVCHRGVVDLSRTPGKSPLRAILESPEGEMKLVYGRGWRGSYGMIGRDQGYWWFKHTLPSSSAEGMDQSLPSEDAISSWPKPFAALARGTEPAGYYVEPVLDRTEAWEWGGEFGRVVCAGDAAHPVTPNMAQGEPNSNFIARDLMLIVRCAGCTTSLMDSLLLPILLRRFLPILPTPLSLLEALYQFHLIRAPHLNTVAHASYIQARVGQWSSPAAVKIREFVMKRIPMEKGLTANREERTGSWIEEWVGYCEEAEKWS